jgi:hypothetical protein
MEERQWRKDEDGDVRTRMGRWPIQGLSGLEDDVARAFEIMEML